MSFIPNKDAENVKMENKEVIVKIEVKSEPDFEYSTKEGPLRIKSEPTVDDDSSAKVPTGPQPVTVKTELCPVSTISTSSTRDASTIKSTTDAPLCCFLCQRSGHTTPQCPDLRCKVCQAQGHAANTCTKAVKEQQRPNLQPHSFLPSTQHNPAQKLPADSSPSLGDQRSGSASVIQDGVYFGRIRWFTDSKTSGVVECMEDEKKKVCFVSNYDVEDASETGDIVKFHLKKDARYGLAAERVKVVKRGLETIPDEALKADLIPDTNPRKRKRGGEIVEGSSKVSKGIKIINIEKLKEPKDLPEAKMVPPLIDLASPTKTLQAPCPSVSSMSEPTEEEAFACSCEKSPLKYCQSCPTFTLESIEQIDALEPGSRVVVVAKIVKENSRTGAKFNYIRQQPWTFNLNFRKSSAKFQLLENFGNDILVPCIRPVMCGDFAFVTIQNKIKSRKSIKIRTGDVLGIGQNVEHATIVNMIPMEEYKDVLNDPFDYATNLYASADFYLGPGKTARVKSFIGNPPPKDRNLFVTFKTQTQRSAITVESGKKTLQFDEKLHKNWVQVKLKNSSDVTITFRKYENVGRIMNSMTPNHCMRILDKTRVNPSEAKSRTVSLVSPARSSKGSLEDFVTLVEKSATDVVIKKTIYNDTNSTKKTESTHKDEIANLCEQIKTICASTIGEIGGKSVDSKKVSPVTLELGKRGTQQKSGKEKGNIWRTIIEDQPKIDQEQKQFVDPRMEPRASHGQKTVDKMKVSRTSLEKKVVSLMDDGRCRDSSNLEKSSQKPLSRESSSTKPSLEVSTSSKPISRESSSTQPRCRESSTKIKSIKSTSPSKPRSRESTSSTKLRSRVSTSATKPRSRESISSTKPKDGPINIYSLKKVYFKPLQADKLTVYIKPPFPQDKNMLVEFVKCTVKNLQISTRRFPKTFQFDHQKQEMTLELEVSNRDGKLGCLVDAREYVGTVKSIIEEVTQSERLKPHQDKIDLVEKQIDLSSNQEIKEKAAFLEKQRKDRESKIEMDKTGRAAVEKKMTEMKANINMFRNEKAFKEEIIEKVSTIEKRIGQREAEKKKLNSRESSTKSDRGNHHRKKEETPYKGRERKKSGLVLKEVKEKISSICKERKEKKTSKESESSIESVRRKRIGRCQDSERQSKRSRTDRNGFDKKFIEGLFPDNVLAETKKRDIDSFNIVAAEDISLTESTSVLCEVKHFKYVHGSKPFTPIQSERDLIIFNNCYEVFNNKNNALVRVMPSNPNKTIKTGDLLGRCIVAEDMFPLQVRENHSLAPGGTAELKVVLRGDISNLEDYSNVVSRSLDLHLKFRIQQEKKQVQGDKELGSKYISVHVKNISMEVLHIFAGQIVGEAVKANQVSGSKSSRESSKSSTSVKCSQPISKVKAEIVKELKLFPYSTEPSVLFKVQFKTSTIFSKPRMNAGKLVSTNRQLVVSCSPHDIYCLGNPATEYFFRAKLTNTGKESLVFKKEDSHVRLILDEDEFYSFDDKLDLDIFGNYDFSSSTILKAYNYKKNILGPGSKTLMDFKISTCIQKKSEFSNLEGQEVLVLNKTKHTRKLEILSQKARIVTGNGELKVMVKNHSEFEQLVSEIDSTLENHLEVFVILKHKQDPVDVHAGTRNTVTVEDDLEKKREELEQAAMAFKEALDKLVISPPGV